MGALLLLEWKGGTAATESFEWVSNTLEIQRELATVEARISEAESSKRGYLLTGQPTFLAPYNAATTDIRYRLINLRRLLADNSAQLRRLLIIESLSRAKLAEFDSTIRLERSGKREAALAVVRAGRSDSLMTTIRSGLQGMIAEEAQLLRNRQKSLVTELQHGDMISLGLAVALALMLVALLVIARGAEHYRNLVTLCAWTRSVEYEGEWISFEEYLRRKFNLSATHGISPDALTEIQNELDETRTQIVIEEPELEPELEVALDEPLKS